MDEVKAWERREDEQWWALVGWLGFDKDRTTMGGQLGQGGAHGGLTADETTAAAAC